MKKVGIASIFRTGNYGGTLQAYALMKAINDNGFGKAEILNYCCDAIKGKIDISYLKKAGFAKTAAALVDKACYFPRMKKMDHFIDSFVQTEELKKEDLAKTNEQYDIFLSGSDQLWNPDIQQGDYFYLLDFVSDPQKKVSYASSFGKKEIPPQYQDKYKELLSQYKQITVREQAGANIVEGLLGTRPKVVLDPTLLLSSEQWRAILPERQKDGKYIFVYRLTYSRLLTEIVAAAQQELKIPVMAVPFLLGSCPHSKAYPSLDSLAWIRGIYDSEYVITDSFHGVVFSILFSKQFYYIVTTPTARERLSRLETLLDSLGIKNRLVDNLASCDFHTTIDYEAVQEKLHALRKDSLQTLQGLLN